MRFGSSTMKVRRFDDDVPRVDGEVRKLDGEVQRFDEDVPRLDVHPPIPALPGKKTWQHQNEAAQHRCSRQSARRGAAL